MVVDGFLVGRQINAIHLVLCNVAMQPLDMGSHILQGFKRLEGNLPELFFRQRSSTRNVAFNDELRHGPGL